MIKSIPRPMPRAVTTAMIAMVFGETSWGERGRPAVLWASVAGRFSFFILLEAVGHEAARDQFAFWNLPEIAGFANPIIEGGTKLFKFCGVLGAGREVVDFMRVSL